MPFRVQVPFRVKGRSLLVVNEHFKPIFNAVIASVIVFQQPDSVITTYLYADTNKGNYLNNIFVQKLSSFSQRSVYNLDVNGHGYLLCLGDKIRFVDCINDRHLRLLEEIDNIVILLAFHAINARPDPRHSS